MRSSVHYSVIDGFNVVTLRNQDVAISVVPALGARIISLLDAVMGREWIWSPAEKRPLQSSATGSSFEASGHTGIDECIPTIGACRWKARSLPDHGEAWSQPWKLDEDAAANSAIVTTVKLPRTPMRLRRQIMVAGKSFTFAYELTSCSDQPEEFIWAWHPLLGLREGDMLELPEGSKEMHLEVAEGAQMAARGDRWSLPHPARGVDLHQLELGSTAPACVKGFIGPLADREVSVRLRGTNGEALTLRWAGKENRWLGLWLSRGYRNWHHVALEPTSGAPDRLDLAVNTWKQFASIAPGEVRKWSIAMELNTRSQMR